MVRNKRCLLLFWCLSVRQLQNSLRQINAIYFYMIAYGAFKGKL
jgi:hypothetical protein